MDILQDITKLNKLNKKNCCMNRLLRDVCTSNVVYIFTGNSSSSIEDEEVESASVDYSEVDFNKSKQCQCNSYVWSTCFRVQSFELYLSVRLRSDE